MKRSYKRMLLGIGVGLLFAAVLAAILFLVAGRWHLPWFWAYVAMLGLLASFSFSLLDPGLVKERWRASREEPDTALIAGKVFSIAHLVIAGLDVGRFHWSPPMPAALQVIGFVLFAVTAAAAVWTMIVNPFFSAVVRIQKDRGHRLITDGPYRFVRHPGYVFVSVMLLANGLALGSWWSIVPMVALIPLIMQRTAREDRFLHENLDGYRDYARRVRYRLVPRIW
jgi:protein-S-isoprenylcysteine O-methyltransferase Ste14